MNTFTDQRIHLPNHGSVSDLAGTASRTLPDRSSPDYPKFLANRYEWWNDLRADGPLVPLSNKSGHRILVATTYAACNEVLTKGVIFQSGAPLSDEQHACALRRSQNAAQTGGTATEGAGSSGSCDPFTNWREFKKLMFLYMDGAENRRIRDPLLPFFKPKQVANLAATIEGLTNSVLDPAFAKGSFDFVNEVARPLTARIILSLLGCDTAMDWKEPAKWAETLGKLNGSVMAVPVESYKVACKALLSARDFVKDLCNDPAAIDRGPLLQALLAMQQHGIITEHELHANAILMLTGAHNTTRSLLGNAVHLLMEHPNEYETLRADPTRAEAVLEATLFFHPVSQTIRRFAHEDTIVAGYPLKKGDEVLCSIAAAQRDRDPVRNPNPDKFEVREGRGVGLAFGGGGKRCIGARMALDEGVALLRGLARRPQLKRIDPQVVYLDDISHHGYETLPVRTVAY